MSSIDPNRRASSAYSLSRCALNSASVMMAHLTMICVCVNRISMEQTIGGAGRRQPAPQKSLLMTSEGGRRISYAARRVASAGQRFDKVPGAVASTAAARLGFRRRRPAQHSQVEA